MAMRGYADIRGFVLAAVLAAAFPGLASAGPRPWPDSSDRIRVFSDQLQESMSEAQRLFAATNLAGTQKMRSSELAAIRAYNTNFLCLHYQLAVGCGSHLFIDGDEWTSDWSAVNSRESWFLHNPSAQRVHQTAWDWDVMDITYSGTTPNTAFPEYWITTCLARVTSTGSDGVFADSFTIDAYFDQCNPTISWFTDIAQCEAHWIPSLQQFARAITNRFAADGRGYLFLPNLGGLITGWDPTDYAVGHGGMIECFALWGADSYFDTADWQLQLDRALALVRSNKIVLCQSYTDTANYRDRMFAAASHLLIRGSRTYFCLVTAGGLEFYPEYTLPLGAATAPPASGIAALWHAPWNVYRRDFANGFVLVNPGDSAVNIASLGGTFFLATAAGGGEVNDAGQHGGTLSYAPVSSLALPAHSGAALLFSTNTAREWIVAPSGGDFTGIQAALNAARAGDTVSVRAGTYNEKLVFPRGGSNNLWLTLRAWPGEQPVLSGLNRAGENMILLNEMSWVRIQGLDIRNNTNVTDGSGIRLLGACRNIELAGNTIHAMRGQNAMGITVYGTNSAPASNLLIRANHIYDCDAAPSEALTINGNVTAFDVSSNLVHDINNIGIDFIGGETDVSPHGVARNGTCRDNRVYRCRSNYGGGYAAGIYVDGGRDIVIERNIVSACDLGMEIGAENAGFDASNIVVRSNLLYDNDKAGLAFGGYEAAVGRTRNCQFLNNTCYRNDTLQDGNGELWIQFASNNLVENNLFFCGPQNLLMASAGPGTASGNTLNHNLWYADAGAAAALFQWRGTEYTGFAAYRAGSGQDAQSLFANPAFLNGSVSNLDAHPAPGSPAIDAGNPAYAPPAGVLDLDRRARVAGGRVDAGAYEFDGSSGPRPFVEITSPTNRSRYASPATFRIDIAAADADGIASVRLFDDATLLANLTAAPYEFTWTNVPRGLHTLTARAMDNAGSGATSATAYVQVTATTRVAAGDFDGDARSDLAVYWPTAGNWYIFQSGSSSMRQQNWGWNDTTPVPADYDGDGRADLASYWAAGGTWFILPSRGGAARTVAWGWSEAVPVAGDFDGDGIADLAVYHPATGNWYIRTLLDQTLAFGLNWGFPSAVPVPGDYNADAATELAVYDTSRGVWHIQTLTGGMLALGTNWGFPGAAPVPGDYNNDRRTDLGVYDPRSGNWYLRTLAGAQLAWATNWGFAGAVAVPGDYGGGAAADLAVDQPAAGRWYARTVGGTILLWNSSWGWSETQPVAPQYQLNRRWGYPW